MSETKKNESILCDRYISAWGASGISSALTEQGMEALEKEKFRKAYVYFSFALQYQPNRLIPRKKMVELEESKEMREQILPEVEKLVKDFVPSKEDEKKLSLETTVCEQCGTKNPEGVRVCLCGQTFAKQEASKWENQENTGTNGNHHLAHTLVYLVLMVMVSAILYFVSFSNTGSNAGFSKKSQQMLHQSFKELKTLAKDGKEENQALSSGILNNLTDLSERMDTLEKTSKKDLNKDPMLLKISLDLKKIQSQLEMLSLSKKGKKKEQKKK